MSNDIRMKLQDARQQVETAERLFEGGLKALSTARLSLSTCEDILLENGIENLPLSDQPISEHRRQHRMGRPPKIDNDPELQAFIMARIDRMTYVQLADAIATHFPEPRRVGKSAIHAWNNRQPKHHRQPRG